MVGPGAVALAYITAELDEGAIFEFDDGRAGSKVLDAGGVRGPGLLLFRRSGVLGQQWVVAIAVGSLGWRWRIGESNDRDVCIGVAVRGLSLSLSCLLGFMKNRVWSLIDGCCKRVALDIVIPLLYIRVVVNPGVTPGLDIVVRSLLKVCENGQSYETQRFDRIYQLSGASRVARTSNVAACSSLITAKTHNPCNRYQHSLWIA